MGVGWERQRAGRTAAQSTALELALDGWRDYGNTDGRLRAMTDGAPQSVRTVLALNGRRDRRTDRRTETPRAHGRPTCGRITCAWRTWNFRTYGKSRNYMVGYTER